MENRRAIALNGITFCHKNGDTVITEGYSLTFRTYEHMNIFIQDRKKYWSDKLNLELVLSPDSIETLVDKDIEKVFHLVCKRLGVSFDAAKSSYQGGPVVKARRMTIAICVNRKVQAVSIANVMGLDHSTISYHVKINKNHYETDNEYRALFLDIQAHVLKVIGGHFKEDGSGRLRPINNN